jgi:hypothetical protein
MLLFLTECTLALLLAFPPPGNQGTKNSDNPKITQLNFNNEIFTKFVILLLLLEKYIRHFRTSRKARYFRKVLNTFNYIYSCEDEDADRKQWLLFEKCLLQQTSQEQALFFSFSWSSAPCPLVHWTHKDKCHSCCHS